ncbi:hypothetical protein J0H58_33710 [bacterium]|nr:hypothetical protein [bacterium]
MTWTRWVMMAITVAAAGGWAVHRFAPLGGTATWERLVSPGGLSAAHAFLADNCAACHVPGRGAAADKCAVCHADSLVLKREPTAFHATVGSCRGCHPEHRGPAGRPTVMDHAALTRIGSKGQPGGKDSSVTKLVRWLADEPHSGPHDGPRREATLNCVTCHATKDRHQTLFGRDCAVCHRTAGWTVPEYRHPSPKTTECAECHQAPPSHYMEHFSMVSATVAFQPHARVRQCFACHQTTAWNDIRGVGWYKHH